jgi:hypothetical protein
MAQQTEGEGVYLGAQSRNTVTTRIKAGFFNHPGVTNSLRWRYRSRLAKAGALLGNEPCYVWPRPPIETRQGYSQITESDPPFAPKYDDRNAISHFGA